MRSTNCLVANTNGTKAQIVEVLSMDFPLSAKRIFNILRKRYQTSSTYTAVYQHIQELVEQGALVKGGLEYQLDSTWINRLGAFADNAKVSYSITNDFISGAGEKIKTLEFESPRRFDEFLMEFRKQFAKFVQKNDKNEIYFLGDHTWGPLMNMRQRIDEIRMIADKGINYYVLMRGACQLDKYMADFYKKAGVSAVKFGVQDKSNEMIMVYNDIVMKAIFPSEIAANINKVFEESASIENIDMIRLIDNFYNAAGKFIVVLIKDKKLAEENKRIMLSYIEDP